MKIQLNNSELTASADVASSVHEEGVVLLRISDGQMFASNVTGARIWCGLKERLSLEVIINNICNDYQIDETTARGHVQRFLVELERQKLIQREISS